MMQCYRDGYEAPRSRLRDLGPHLGRQRASERHPAVVRRTCGPAREAILEFGREVARLGGCPLAEHGVGRSALKQALLRQLYGDAAIDEMRAIKRALDPDWKLAPGVIFGAP